MCIAVPGRLIAQNGSIGIADCAGYRMEIYLGLVDVGIGDFLLIHAGCAIERIEEDRANELTHLLLDWEIKE